MTFTPTAINYQVEIPIEDFRKIMRKDSDNLYNQPDLSTLLDRVEGVDQTDYNGHFGNYIFFRVESQYDTSSTKDKIQSIIENYLKL